MFFLWAPLNFDDECLHYMVFEDSAGVVWSTTAAVLPVISTDGPVFDLGSEVTHLGGVRHHVRWAPGLRRSNGAQLTFRRADSSESVNMEPLHTFRMRGAGYFHPVWAHGRWHGGAQVAGEEHKVSDLDSLSIDCIHVQQVMKATWGDRQGLGVLEQLAIGPHAPSGFRELLDGATPAANSSGE
jgi:hypothetical protein